AALREGNTGVYIDDLADYLKVHCDRWAQVMTGSHQRPMLLPSTGVDRFEVHRPTSDQISAARAEISKPGSYPEKLKDAWANRDQWKEIDKGYCFTPCALREFEARLLHAEHMWAAGDRKGIDDDIRIAIKLRPDKVPPQAAPSLSAFAGPAEQPAAINAACI